MKRILALFMAVIMLLSLVGCNSTGDFSNNILIEVHEGTTTVDIIIPALLVSAAGEDQFKNSLVESGLNYTINEDGSATLTVTKAQHQEIVDSLRASIDNTIESTLNNNDTAASFVSIYYTDDLSEFSIYVNKEDFALLDRLHALTFCMNGAYYQALTGVAVDELNVKTKFIDNNTGKVLTTITYKECIFYIKLLLKIYQKWSGELPVEIPGI